MPGVLRALDWRFLVCEEPCRQLFIRPLCLLTYRRTYANQGETTSGVSQETVDGI